MIGMWSLCGRYVVVICSVFDRYVSRYVFGMYMIGI